jgi:predicted RNase H-like HicB family nuclease
MIAGKQVEMESMEETDSDSRHSVMFHRSLPGTIVTLAGGDGEDAKPYQERVVKEVIERLRQVETRSVEPEGPRAPCEEREEAPNLASRYAMVIEWSTEDDAFVVCVPDLPGLYTHGATREEAVAMGTEAIELWLDCAQELGLPAPLPTFGVLASASHAFGALWSDN